MDKYAELRAALADGSFDFDQRAYMNDIRSLLAERDEYARILDGLPQDAIDGGWTAKGISSYAKTLEAERDALREALKCIARTQTKPGDDKAAPLLASIINLAFAALAQEQGEKHDNQD